MRLRRKVTPLDFSEFYVWLAKVRHDPMVETMMDLGYRLEQTATGTALLTPQPRMTGEWQ